MTTMQLWRSIVRKIVVRTGVEIWRGPSTIDGFDIMAIATGFKTPSENIKTGDMVQVFILLQDVAPHIAVKTGQDRSVCGDCRHRFVNDGSCYEVVHRAPRQVYVTWARGNYPLLSDVGGYSIFDGAKVRLGSWGDPGALPYGVVAAINRHAETTGYTHRWRQLSPSWQHFLMASVDTDNEQREARRLGWRCFRVKRDGTEVAPDLVERTKSCPGVLDDFTCGEHCMQCGGGSGVDRVVNVHGVKASRFTG